MGGHREQFYVRTDQGSHFIFISYPTSNRLSTKKNSLGACQGLSEWTMALVMRHTSSKPLVVRQHHFLAINGSKNKNITTPFAWAQQQRYGRACPVGRRPTSPKHGFPILFVLWLPSPKICHVE